MVVVLRSWRRESMTQQHAVGWMCDSRRAKLYLPAVGWFLLSLCSWGRVELEESVLQVLVNFHDGCLVAAPVAVIGRTKDGHHVLLVAPVVPFHDKLVGTRNEGQAVVVIELLGNVLAESISGATWTNTPSTTVIGVRPQQIADRTFVGDLCKCYNIILMFRFAEFCYRT